MAPSRAPTPSSTAQTPEARGAKGAEGQRSEHFLEVQAAIEGNFSDYKALKAMLPEPASPRKPPRPVELVEGAKPPKPELGEQLYRLREDVKQMAVMLDKRLCASSARLEAMSFQVQSLDRRIEGMQSDRSITQPQHLRSGPDRPGRKTTCGASAGPTSQWAASLPPESALGQTARSKSVQFVDAASPQACCLGPSPKDFGADEPGGPVVVDVRQSDDPGAQSPHPSPRIGAERDRQRRAASRASEASCEQARRCFTRSQTRGSADPFAPDSPRSLMSPLEKFKTMAFGEQRSAGGRRRTTCKKKRGGALHCMSGVLIFLNVVFMIASVQLSMKALLEGRDPPPELWWVAFGFALAFTFELLARALQEKKGFVVGRSWGWNLFDTFILLLQWMDLLNGFFNVSTLRGLRTLRVAPAARLIRWLRNAQELRLMIAAIRCSLVSMMWALLLLGSVVLLYALALQQTVQAQIESNKSTLTPLLAEYYGGLQKTMLTVFMAISGGVDWKESVSPLEEISQFYLVVFALFVAFLLFGLLNILAAIFVEQSCRVRQNNAIDHVRDILESMGDSCQILSAEEVEDMLHDRGFVAHLKSVSLNATEVRGLFQLLDPCRNGFVDTQEFTSALMRLTGNARAVDVATMFYENKRILALVSSLAKSIEDNFLSSDSLRGRQVSGG